MASNCFWSTTRIDFGSTTIQYFLIDLLLIMDGIDIASYADDSTPHVSADNIDEVNRFFGACSQFII